MSERFTFNQVNQQESTAYINRSNTEPTVLVKRTDGRVTVGNLNKDTRTVSFSENGQNFEKPGMAVIEFSDQRQAELATELAGAALRGSEASSASVASPTETPEAAVVSPDSEKATLEASLDELKESMAESDQIPAWRYATALHDHELNRALGQLSPEGKSQAIRYRELYEKLKALHD